MSWQPSNTTTTSQAASVMQRISRLLTEFVWLWPLCGLLIVIAAGVWIRGGVERAIENELAAHLQTILNAEVNSVRVWFKEKEAYLKLVAADPRVRTATTALLELDAQGQTTGAQWLSVAPAKELQDCLRPVLEPQEYVDYVLVARLQKRVLASSHQELVGQTAPAAYDEYLRRVWRGQSAGTGPFPSEVPLRDAGGTLRRGIPTQLIFAPVKDAHGGVVAALALRLKPEQEFSQLFAVAYMGESGETYAFDRDAILLTPGRFESELKSLGLLAERDEGGAVLHVRLSDPGVDLHSRSRRNAARAEPALTRMGADATSGLSGFDTRGYRDYRGVPVVGAWTWLPDYKLGIATELAVEEAYEPVYFLRRTFLTLFLLLLLACSLIFGFSLTVRRLQAAVRKAALSSRQLGQYALVQVIGAGGNGKVYKARHALLRRPVAIKLLDPAKADAATLDRFEREVQVTSQLTHPNTVAIYDYGRTPEGLFYYAMEFLDGFNLERLVHQFGAQPEGRVIGVLRQVCGSLAEAHALGLIHRDIKPSNIFLTRRGGVCDVAKVLDFGVAKATNKAPPTQDRGAALDILGTPSFLPPEAVETPEDLDARSDLYALGAVGYFLLTGKLLFEVDTLKQWLQAQVHTQPRRPSERRGRPIAADLEEIIMSCLAKGKAQRPASANQLSERLSQCHAARAWTPDTAAQWWRVHVAPVESDAAIWLQEKTTLITAPAPNGLAKIA